MKFSNYFIQLKPVYVGSLGDPSKKVKIRTIILFMYIFCMVLTARVHFMVRSRCRPLKHVLL